ncbi:hypothetical protein [Amphritea pacifica]|uniref:hypothetical protein n=1 Tax=Amphritea pacifica TaxID=2811233 RepID=UPI001963B5D4|nr:hypothetical protein [Amphritea pacifica]MBN1006860.1 hypothetical protein [Amphritea pacifica]
MKYLLVSSLFALLVGCASSPKNEFAQQKSFVKTIRPGLYFIREADSAIFWRKEGVTRQKWQERAENLCVGSGYKSLLLVDGESSSTGVAMSFVGGIGSAYGEIISVPITDGVILCDSANISEEEAITVLEDEYYIEPQ